MTGPPAPAMRSWRHPSELSPPPSAPPPLHRGIVAGTAVVTLLVVVGVSRVLVPGTLEQATGPTSNSAAPLTVGRAERRPPISNVEVTAPAITTSVPVAATTTSAAPVTASSTPPTAATPTSSLPSAPDVVGAARTSRDDVFAVAVQDGALYVTTRAAVGDAPAITLSVDGRELVGRVLAIDEEVGIAVLHVASAVIDPSAIDRLASMAPDVTSGDTVRIAPGNDEAPDEVKGTVGAASDHALELKIDGAPVGDGVPVLDVEGHLVGLTADGGRRLIVVESLRQALAATADASLGRSTGTRSIGIEGSDVSSSTDCAGVRVLEVAPGSPGALAGLRADDVIVGFDGATTPARVVHSTADLALDIDDHSSGERVGLVVERDGRSIILELTLA